MSGSIKLSISLDRDSIDALDSMRLDWMMNGEHRENITRSKMIRYLIHDMVQARKHVQDGGHPADFVSTLPTKTGEEKRKNEQEEE